MNFAQLVAEDQRLCILLILLSGGQYSHNEFVLRRALEQFAHHLSADRLRTEISWLAEQGLLDKSESGSVWTATLTQRGKDTAEGKTTVPGVKRPEPGM
jgi:hypothetical protein